MEVQSHRVLDYSHTKNPGDFFITSAGGDGVRGLLFLCPCGCGDLCGIRVNDSGTTESNCWAWDRNFDAPTCTPSIEILGKLQDDGSFPWHWHGYLTNGIFRSC